MRWLRLSWLFSVLFSAAAMAQNNPVPFVNQPLVPATVVPGHKAFTLTVNGTGFVPHSTVYWNGGKRVTRVVSSTQLQARISASDVAPKETASVTVVNPTPGGGVSNVVFLPVRDPAPSVAFSPTVSFGSAQGALAGDFNNDGKQDVAVGVQNSDGSGEIDIYLGKGDGTFEPPVGTKSVTNAAGLLAGDFNNDGQIDLAVEDGTGNISIFINRGNGHMQQTQVFDAEQALAAADFNGDGNLDLLVGSYDPKSKQQFVSICLGNGDGTFGAPQPIAGSGIYGVPAVGDFNADGALDFAIAWFDQYGAFLYVMLGNGDGTFRYGSGNDSLPYPGTAAAAADVNRDGILDIVTNGVTVLLGNGDGTFTVNGGVSLPSGNANLNVGDFNGDGKVDVATAGNQILYLMLGNGDGTFQSPLQFDILYGFTTMSMADFNNDGRLDLVGSSLFLSTSASLVPSSINFGQVSVGQKSQPQTATVTNVGDSNLVIEKIGINGTNSKDFQQTNNCPASLGPNKSCQINVVFAPTESGSLSATLFVNHSGLGSPATVALSGTGVDLTATLTPSDMKFGVQLVHTTSQSQTATLTNTGSQAVTITSISTANPFNQGNNCPSSLQPNNSCQIQVTFTPTIGGKAVGTLDVYDNAQGSPQTVSLSGIGTAVKFAPGSVNFGNQKVGTKSAPFPIELINEGSTSLSVSRVTTSGADPGDFSQTNNCKSVPPGGHCNIRVRFGPTAKGKRSATLDVYDDGGGSPQKASLAGTGT
jgi:hypothetical protein